MRNESILVPTTGRIGVLTFARTPRNWATCSASSISTRHRDRRCCYRSTRRPAPHRTRRATKPHLPRRSGSATQVVIGVRQRDAMRFDEARLQASDVDEIEYTETGYQKHGSERADERQRRHDDAGRKG